MNAAASTWRPIKIHCLGSVPPAVIVTQNSPDTHTHSHTLTHTHMNALMQAGRLLTDESLLACLHANLNSQHTRGIYFCHFRRVSGRWAA